MYPTLTDFSICGTTAVPRLCHRKGSLVYDLPGPAFVSVVADCNGINDLSTLAKKHGVSEGSMRHFVDSLQREGVLECLSAPLDQPHTVLQRLGPQEPWLSEVHIDITDRCNLVGQCPHCYRGDLLNQRVQRPAAEWRKVIDDLAALGVYRLAISGGEPFMRKDLLDVIVYAYEQGLLVSGIFTNGTVDSTVFTRVLEYIERTGLHTTFYVSLDGPDEATNSRYRGEGSFAQTWSCLQRLGEARQHAAFNVTVNSQVSIHTIDRLEEWYERLTPLGITRWRMNGGRLAGRLREHKELVVTEDRLARAYAGLLERYLTDRAAGRHPFKLTLDAIFRSEMLDEGVAHTFSPDLPMCDYKLHAVSIEPTGDVQFCTSWTGQHFGNVFVEGIEAIWYSEQLQALKTRPLSAVTGCTSCELLSLCGGGCRHTASSLTAPDHHACARYSSFQKHIVPIMEREGIVFRPD